MKYMVIKMTEGQLQDFEYGLCFEKQEDVETRFTDYFQAKRYLQDNNKVGVVLTVARSAKRYDVPIVGVVYKGGSKSAVRYSIDVACPCDRGEGEIQFNENWKKEGYWPQWFVYDVTVVRD